MKVANIIEAVGRTPLVELSTLSPKPGVRLFAKLEGVNPAGSVKDRVARAMILEAEASGALTKDKIILEPTSGNTGLALALLGRRLGYRVAVVLPDNVGPERQQALRAFGAEIIFSDGRYGSNGAILKAQEIATRDARYFMPFQYANPANPRAHYETTGPEILADLEGEVDVFVAGLGTGGTLMGVGRRLREVNPKVKVVAVEPHPGEQVQGLRSLADGYIPPILDLAQLDAKFVVRSADAFAGARLLLEREGIFSGVSGGAVIQGALRAASRIERGNVVALLADAGWKYLSAGFWTAPRDQFEQMSGDQLWW
ncbi:MAG: cysteine synthase family protein [Chloroflexota bacterium]|nr:cysteine synthase family protein [Dehalococcoidia bacterium]MDW8252279.1 cysteine synthase family protein [Chloroflexota bacterium]